MRLTEVSVFEIIIFRRVYKVAKSDYELFPLCPSVSLPVCPFIRLSVRMEQPGFHWTDIREILYLFIFWKSIEKIQFYYFSQNIPTKITGTLYEDQYTFLNTARSFLLRMRNVADLSCREDEKYTFYTQNVFRKSCLLWDNAKKKLSRRTSHRWQYKAHAHCILYI
jgi:hypothetical protein